MPLKITTIDCRSGNAAAEFAALREKLSPRGDVVSAAGKQRTTELFGEPLSPQQVVERICSDVRSQGLSALLDYTRKLDRTELTAETLRVSPAEMQRARDQVGEPWLKTVRTYEKDLLSQRG